ncbi:MAG: asparagine synthase (glutamine-hydrolyzing) [Gemmataceae bacterium]
MCGIAGIVGSRVGKHQDAVQRMLGALTHRGPDGSGLWVSPSEQCVLGHRRLAILDLSAAAAQPMCTPDRRFVLSYNGECYNYRDLRRQLHSQGVPIQSSGDTEVLLHLLARQHQEGLRSLNAMFALALWDEREGRLLLARDLFGQKPLYWCAFEDGLIFASEVRAILASGLVPRRLNLAGLRSYLCHGAVQGPDTIVSGVWLLPRASTLAWHREIQPVVASYWRTPQEQRPAALGEIRDGFFAAVERHLISDVPAGVFLSGGVDSSAAAAAAVRRAGSGVTSLSVVFPDQPEQSEAEHARRMAEMAGTRHIEVPVTGGDMLAMLEKSLASMDQPTIDAVNTYIVSRAARQAGLTVALSGLGGDELFGGYPSFSTVPHLLRLRRALGPVRRPAGWLLRTTSLFGRQWGKIADLLEAPPGVLPAYAVRRRLFSSRQVRALAPRFGAEKWLSGLDPARMADLQELVAGRALPDAVGHLELEWYMGQTLLRDSDVMGMACSLEIRCPFLDKDFAELVLAQPPQARMLKGVRKWLLIEALRDLLPEANWRRPKQGFALPMQTWMLGPLRQQVEDELSCLAAFPGLFDGGSLQELWSRFQAAPAEIGWSRPWGLFVLGAYLREHKLTPDGGEDQMGQHGEETTRRAS